ncbi:hypothetical protein ESCOCK374M_22930 [Escherichia coli]
MPPRTPKTCRVRGYRNTTTDPSGYCKSHKSEGWKQYKSGQSCHQRGYGSRGCPSCSPVLCGGGEETGRVFRSVRPWSHDAGLSDIEFIANKPERLRVLSGDPAGYGAEGARVFAIYENFPV